MSKMETVWSGLRTVDVTSTRREAIDIVSLELTAQDGAPLPPFVAGAHIDVHLGPDRIRSYSLANAPRERNRYLIAVKHEKQGRGGSRQIHETVETGKRLAIGMPRNYFMLPPGHTPLLFIAGGIGITPIRAMIHEADDSGRPWRLHYAARSLAHAAFAEDLAAYGPERVHFWFSGAGERLALDRVLADVDERTHLLCCGPARLLNDIEAATASWNPERVRMEWFRAEPLRTGADTAFDVELRRSGRVLHVPAGRSLLDVLHENGISVPFACHEGICGTCETRVLAGSIDHKDRVLPPEERAQGRVMMVCVSRARSGKLVLDL
jgi:vanillate O-demethylase ferredoxin subunit